MLPFSSHEHHPPRRNARSLDLDDSAIKAAAWVWHLHDSKPGITTEGRFLSSQGRRRSSSSSDRRGSRFCQEAAELTRMKAGRGAKFETPMWDCGSNLYDTFELVSFGNRLDRSLMEVVVPAPPPPYRKAHVNPQEHQPASPLDHEPGGLLRTVSLTQSTAESRLQKSKKHTDSVKANNTDRVSLTKSRELSFSLYAQDPPSKRWPNVGKLRKAFKKVVDLHKQVGMSVGCKNSINIVEPSQRPKEPHEPDGGEGFMAKKVRSISHEGLSGSTPMQEGRINNSRRRSLDDGLLNRRRRKDSVLDGAEHAKTHTKPALSQSQSYHKHLHHHHHHHHHHYLLRPLASKSARLSPDTMSKLCADKSWITS